MKVLQPISIKVGDKFNKLTFKQFIGFSKVKNPRQKIGKFTCECGNEKVLSINAVKFGEPKSCGCLKSYNIKIGDRINHLVLIEDIGRDEYGDKIGKFKCDCGNEYICPITNAFTQKILSCGCMLGKRKSPVFLDNIKIGDKFNNLIFKEDKGKNSWQHRIGVFTCNCGNEIQTLLKRVASGEVMSCGCLRNHKSSIKKIEIGQKFNKLTFLGEIENKSEYNGHMGLFRCDCKTEKSILMYAVISGNTKSCGCLRRADGWEGTIYKEYKNSATKRKLDFTIGLEDFKKIILDKCYYCGDESSSVHHKKYKYNGIDRIDNDIGYTKENSVTCCKICNFMKRILDKDVFINQCKKISNNLKFDRK